MLGKKLENNERYDMLNVRVHTNGKTLLVKESCFLLTWQCYDE